MRHLLSRQRCCSARAHPFGKLLLGEDASPWLLAGLLYLGSGLGLAIIQLFRAAIGKGKSEASLIRADIPWLILIVLTDGVAGPARSSGLTTAIT